jgi:uncharacterized protein YdhG (YjbR/CyaY superfamily)
VPKTPGLEDIASYIAQFEPEIREVLERVRRAISHAAPDAKETISYLTGADRREFRPT